jgi:Outer membrane protein beta-barrel domain
MSLRFALMALAVVGSAPRTLTAQARSAIGVELGYTRATFSGRNSGGVTLHEGAVAGGYFQANLTSWLSVRPGIQIASKGGASTLADSAGPVRVDLDLVYLDLPVLLRSRIPAIGRSRVILTGGAVPSLRIGCNVETSRGGVTLARSECGQASVAIFRTWDVELLAGLGFGIPIESSEFAIEARFTQGFRSVTDIGDIKNRALTFLISVPF